MSDANYSVASDLLDPWYEEFLSGKPPVRFRVHDGALNMFELGPGLITLLGGAPGVGKTAFTMQCVINALRLQQDLRVAVCNVEMSAESLIDRAFAYFSGVPLTTIRNRQVASEQVRDRVETALEILKSIAARLCFIRPPFEIQRILEAAKGFGAALVVVDYVQRIAVGGQEFSPRGQIDEAMAILRGAALEGLAILAVSAVSRNKGANGGSTYDPDAMGLASFRESSELEYGADAAYILAPADESGDEVVLKGLKNRHGETGQLSLSFNKRLQRFSPLGENSPEAAPKSKRQQLQALWADAARGGGEN